MDCENISSSSNQDLSCWHDALKQGCPNFLQTRPDLVKWKCVRANQSGCNLLIKSNVAELFNDFFFPFLQWDTFDLFTEKRNKSEYIFTKVMVNVIFKDQEWNKEKVCLEENLSSTWNLGSHEMLQTIHYYCKPLHLNYVNRKKTQILFRSCDFDSTNKHICSSHLALKATYQPFFKQEHVENVDACCIWLKFGHAFSKV